MVNNVRVSCTARSGSILEKLSFHSRMTERWLGLAPVGMMEKSLVSPADSEV